MFDYSRLPLYSKVLGKWKISRRLNTPSIQISIIDLQSIIIILIILSIVKYSLNK